MKRIAMAAFVLLVMGASLAEARVRLAPISERVAASTLVALGKVTKVEKAEEGTVRISLEVTETMKGKGEGVVSIVMTVGRRNAAPSENQEVIAFLKEGKDGVYELALQPSLNSFSNKDQADAVRKAVADEKAKEKGQ